MQQAHPDRRYNVLFLCTGNSARSILAESILRKSGAGRFNAFSAGSFPKGEVNPLALETLHKLDYPVDDAAGELCPVWPGHPVTAHWGIEDPAIVQGTEVQKLAAFATAFRYLKNRILLFTALPLANLDRMRLQHRLDEIGRGTNDHGSD
jgi:arsenate reductase